MLIKLILSIIRQALTKNDNKKVVWVAPLKKLSTFRSMAVVVLATVVIVGVVVTVTIVRFLVFIILQ
ncbi:5140_t:CDS:2 [Entrophospora sp. SA101]|nr:5140_t:CDS:2 [Entrophospora sp. SA101]CAJ0899367.1 16086_t:CDS:2 [Entrophospora sp. SA101]